MITLLAKKFIKNTDIESAKVRKAYGTLCSIVGIILNILLFIGKILVGTISGSIAITADAYNNLSDAGSSFITLVGFWFAGKKPDTEHPFGHGRFEYISGLMVSIAIILMGIELAKSSFEKIIHPQPIDTSLVAIVVLIAAIAVKVYMAMYNRKFGNKIDSSAMKATSTDSMSDSVATSVVLISLLINKFTYFNIDGICGLIVAAFILYAGYSTLRETITPLLGQPPKKEFVASVQKIVMAYDEVRGIHDLVVHDYGPGRVMISLHAEVPGDGDIFQIHDMIDRIEMELNEKLSCEAVIHMDPIEVDNKVLDRMRDKINNIVKSINEKMSIHDFRMVVGDTHTNLIFDVVIPYEVKEEDEVIKQKIRDKIAKENTTYFAVIHIDRDYVTSYEK